jgi:hypothetical protein
MSEEILDGTGGGYTAQVTPQHRLEVSAITEPEDRHLNDLGTVWSTYFAVTAVGAGDYFFYLKNTGTNPINITDIRISSSVATQINYHAVSGDPTYAATNTSTTTNRNLGSSRTPSATIRDDTNITGLTDDGIIFFEECAVVNTRYHLRTSANIIIPQGTAIAFERVEATGLVTCLVSVVEISEKF